MSYSALPAEIQSHIANYLDTSNAISLAQTCSISQEVAEGRIYRDIHIDHIDRFAPSTHSNDSGACAQTGEKIYTPYLRLLQRHPWRPRSLRSLQIEPQFTTPLEMGQLINLVREGLHHLRIMFPTGLLVPQRILDGVGDLIGNTEFRSLRKVEIDIGTQWDCLGRLLSGSRGLRSLYVRGAEIPGAITSRVMGMVYRVEVPGDDSRSKQTDNNNDNDLQCFKEEIPEILNLEYLVIDRMNPDPKIALMIATIINQSPKLRQVVIRDSQILWLPFPPPSVLYDDDPDSDPPSSGRKKEEEEEEGYDPLILALSENTAIEILEIPSNYIGSMERLISQSQFQSQTRTQEERSRSRSGLFQNISNLTIVWEFPHLHACTGSRQFSNLRPRSDRTNHTPILIPSLPNVKHCIFTLRTHYQDPNSPPYNIYRGHVFDMCIKAIRYQALNQGFENTPLLHTIQLKDMYGSPPNPHRASSELGGSHERCETEFDGCFITRYELGGGGDKLVFVRHRTAHSCGWEEYGVFNGREVPKSCLDGVMSSNGVYGWKRLHQPARGELTDEAWDLLRHSAELI